jgi:hypothetical protein
VVSTRAKARYNIKRSGPFLRRDLAQFYSAIDIWSVQVKLFETKFKKICASYWFRAQAIGFRENLADYK